MTVRVITDSAAALPPAVAAAHGITVVPMRVVVGGTGYRDGDLSLPDLVARLGEGVTTSGPSPGDFAEALAATPGEALLVTLADRLSSTHQSAVLGAAAVGGRVRVVDTGTAAGAQALVALHAARVAQQGGSLSQVEAAACDAAARVRLVGALDTLQYLIRGGRVDPAIGGLANRLGIRPIFELADGRIRRLRPALSRQGAIERLITLWRKTRTGQAQLHVIALHVMAHEDATRLLERIHAETQPATALVAEFGAVMVAHTGPGLVALAWWWEHQH